MGRSSVGRDGMPVATWPREPGLPAVDAGRFGPGLHRPGRTPGGDPHTHDFVVLTHVETGAGSMRVNSADRPAAAGDLFVIAPGDRVASGDIGGLATATGWCVFFPPDVLAPPVAGGLVSWRAHPLLAPFTAGAVPARRLHVPAAARPAWSARYAALEAELAGRRDGYAEAAVALLTLLLVDVTRLAADMPGGLRSNGEPLLAAVFDVIETNYAGPLSLRDVAAAVGLTPGHLTTTVARKTGRTVQQWITQRRMAEARQLLACTELTVAATAARSGYSDAGYFIRTFKRDHGITPTQWRRTGGRPATVDGPVL